jgi:hypothetical protein
MPRNFFAQLWFPFRAQVASPVANAISAAVDRSEASAR